MTTLLKDIKDNPENPRTITEEKLKMLKDSLKEFGDLSCIIFNRKTKHLIGGHQRKGVLPKDSKVTIVSQYKKPTKVGTVAEGYVLANGERFPYREVEWDKTKEKAATIAANKGAGEWDIDQLSNWMKELDGEFFNLDLTMFNEEERFSFLQEIDKVNKGSENDEWAKMEDEEQFKTGGEYITVALHFKTEDAREKYVKKQKWDVSLKHSKVWIVKL